MKRCPICTRPFPVQERFCSVHGLPLVEERLEIGDRAGELSGSVLDHRYRLAGVAGRGGMGVVYEAENLRIGRRCAVKVLHPQLHADEKMRMRLFREVQAASRVRHPNVVEILDYGHDDVAGSYLVMEFVDGQSLGTVIREHSPMPLPFVFKIAIQLTAALSATHARGLIHRDLTPSNARMMASGLVKVLDFGLVKPFERSDEDAFATISTGGIAFGTPWYMSPEQASFRPLDPRSDIYSLGIVLYEMITGKLPFSGASPLDVIEAQIRKPVPLPRLLEPPVEVPAGLEMLLLRALNKEPAERYQTMAEVMDELYSVAARLGISLADLSAPHSRSTAATTEETLPGDLGGSEPSADPAPTWTLAIPAGAPPALALVPKLVQERKAGMVERIVDVLRSTFPRYRNVSDEPLRAAVGTLLDAATRALEDVPADSLSEDMRELLSIRHHQHFSPTEWVGALWMGFAATRPLLKDAAGDSIDRYLDLQDVVDQRVLPLILRTIDYYVAQSQSALHDVNEQLARRNEELEHLRNTLTDRMRRATARLAEAEQLKARVADSISSGLMLVERGSRRLLLFNKAMERLTGLAASQVLDRAMDEAVAFVEGVPFDEFVEQIRMHGEVGLRKLRLRMTSGIERAVYVRGQAFYSPKMEHTGTLFVLDDVTEREQIIKSFSRYVSRDVVDRVMRQGESLQCDGEPREAVVLAVNICNFGSLRPELSVPAMVELLGEYVRTVGDAVFHHGGTIDNVVADSILVYFADSRGKSAPAVAAAIELVRRFEGINERREREKKPLIHVGIGMHAGQVLMLNVGGQNRMVHTLVGDVAQTALALRDIASSGEVLLTEAVVKAGEADLQLQEGPVLQVAGHQGTLSAYRLIFELDPVVSPATVN